MSTSGADLCLVDENNFTSSDTVYGPTGKDILQSDHAVLLFPRQPLTDGSYSVVLSQPGASDIAWSFSVADQTPPAAPEVAATDRCSASHGRTGALELTITNVADGAGPATYSVSADGVSATTTAVADGASVSAELLRLPPGDAAVSVYGSAGSAAHVTQSIDSCPAWQDVRVRFRKRNTSKRPQPALLDNRLNGGVTTFTVKGRGLVTQSFSVPGATKRTVTIALKRSGPKTVTVVVSGHTVATEHLT